MATTHDQFPTDITGLPTARASEVVELGDGDRFDLKIAPVAKRVGDAAVRMLSYNGSIPGPTLKVREGSELVVDIENQGDTEATVHWHGLRLENRYDGTHETQQPMGSGERYTAHVTFPDPGVYWYHPHIREDYGQEMGLYGNVIVEPADPDYWPPVHREVNGADACSTRSATSRQTNESDAFGRSTPGSRPASQRIWKPLQIPSTGPPAAANSTTAPITGEKRAIAPQRR